MRKEKYIWLPITAMGVIFVGMILSFFDFTELQGFILVGSGLIMAVIGLILNFKAKHILSLVTIFISILALNVSLIGQVFKSFDDTIQTMNSDSSSSVDSSDDSSYLDSTSSTDTLTVADLTQYTQDDTVSVGNETIKVNSVKNTDKDYIAINVTITNTSSGPISYSDDNFEVANGNSDSVMGGIYSSLAADNLGSNKFSYLSDGSIKPGESVTGDLLYDNSYTYSEGDGSNYLVVNVGGTRLAAIKLN
ncbi:DUF4352 domain-containing protein [Weissella muntiaci]|uniref:DUF4352 domain-containing protein n=1 Tax=Weissella muntiaci TaxID=2508881 RepID=A0A6C2CBV0_9LACO|nr:DUF4352 domain-containing protein [Weissella muntiaci]TYC50969.1 DUF4352 domain-containing protein [Weissella muntiaci]